MSVFEYVSVFVAIVLGLAVARVMNGIGAFIISNNRSADDWLLAGWCLSLIVNQIGWWMLGWVTYGQLEIVPYGAVLAWFTSTALLFLASYILVPGGCLVSTEPSAVMGTLRPSFFVCLALHFCSAIVFAYVALDGIFTRGEWFVVVMAALSAIGAFLRSTSAHFVHLFVWVCGVMVLNMVGTPTIGTY